MTSDASTNALGWSARANATYRATPSLTVQASYNHRAPMNVEQGRSFGQQPRVRATTLPTDGQDDVER